MTGFSLLNDWIFCKGAYYLLVDPLELYHKLVMELIQGQAMLCWVGGFAYIVGHVRMMALWDLCPQ